MDDLVAQLGVMLLLLLEGMFKQSHTRLSNIKAMRM